MLQEELHVVGVSKALLEEMINHLVDLKDERSWWSEEVRNRLKERYHELEECIRCAKQYLAPQEADQLANDIVYRVTTGSNGTGDQVTCSRIALIYGEKDMCGKGHHCLIDEVKEVLKDYHVRSIKRE